MRVPQSLFYFVDTKLMLEAGQGIFTIKKKKLSKQKAYPTNELKDI